MFKQLLLSETRSGLIADWELVCGNPEHDTELSWSGVLVLATYSSLRNNEHRSLGVFRPKSPDRTYCAATVTFLLLTVGAPLFAPSRAASARSTATPLRTGICNVIR